MFHIGSAFLLLMCGLIVLVQGVDFRDGYFLTNSNGTDTQISYTYTSIQGLEGSSGISVLLIMLSIALFIYTFFEFKYVRNRGVSYSEEED
jgi:hypothetical protein